MIDVTFPSGYDEVTALHLTQWDYGQKLNIYGCNLANGTQVHFYNKPSRSAMVKEGTLVTVDGVSHLEVDIPDSLMENTFDIRAYIYVTTETSGQSTKKIVIPVVPRTKPDDYVSGDDPAVHSITEAVRIANEAKDIAEESDATADAAVVTANAASATADEAETKADNAVSTANTAIQNASAAVSTANAADAKVDAQDADIATFKSTVNGEIADQNDEIDAFKSTVNGQIATQNGEISTFENTVNGQIDELESQITQGLGTKVSAGGTVQNTWNADTKADKSTEVSKTLTAASWTGTEAPFSYSLAVTGVTATNNNEILPATNITAEQLEALQGANLQDGGQASGTITLKAFGDKPEVNIPIRVIVRGD